MKNAVVIGVEFAGPTAGYGLHKRLKEWTIIIWEETFLLVVSPKLLSMVTGVSIMMAIICAQIKYCELVMERAHAYTWSFCQRKSYSW